MGQSVKNFLSVFFVISLVGCASVRTDVASSERYTDINSAAVHSKALASLKYDSFINIGISDISPSISIENASGKFEIVSVDGKKNQPFNFIVTSICDCLGFNKRAIYPTVYLLNDVGNVVSTEKTINPKTRSVNGTYALDGTYKLLIIANSKNAGKKIGDAQGYIGGVIPFAIDEVVHPTGSVNVSWKKPN